MKKILVPTIIAALCFMGSCKSSKSESDPFEPALQVYRFTALQNDIALDPFNIAYRLNAYLNSGGSNLQQTLFPTATIESQDSKTYTITYAELVGYAENDMSRTGVVIVKTNGTKLTDTDAIWEVITDPENLYVTNNPEFGYFQTKIADGEYLIRNVAANSWHVTGDQLYIQYLSTTGASLWDLDVKVTQTQGTSVENSRFQIEPGDSPYGGGMSSTGKRFRYEILNPVLYSSSCAYLSKSGGEERIVLMDDYGFTGIDTITLNFGQQYACDPSFSVTAKIDDVYKTQNY